MNPAKTNPRPELEERLRFETLIADLSSKFVNLPPGEVGREIMDAQRRICDLLSLDVSSLWQWLPEAPEVLTLTHLYRFLDGPPTPERMAAAEYFPWCQRKLQASRIVVLSSLEELPDEAARDRETFRHFNIKSGLIIPLSAGGAPPIGALSFGTVRAERDWPVGLVKRLQQVADLFTNALTRKRGEEALRLSEARLAAGADIAGLGFVEVDEGTGAVFADDRFRELIGVPPDWEQGMQIVAFWKEHLHPDDVPRVLRERQEALDGKREELVIDYRYLHPTRGEMWIQHIGRPTMRDATGFAVKSFSVFRDITERRRAEDQIRQLSLAVEQSPVSVVITDLQGRIIYVNRKFSELSGYSFAECIGQNPRILKSGETSASTYQELWARITSGGTWRGEFHNRKKNGELYWEWAVISPLLDATGKATHFVGVKEDITERKQTDWSLHDLSRRLIRAHEEERARLARELHDDVTQRLARLAIDAGRVECGTDGVSATEMMQSIREGLVNLSEDIHALSYRLHPSMLEDLGLAEALKAECERFSKQESVPAEVTLRELPDIVPPETALCLFRVAQEALRNVARHARARRVEVLVRPVSGGLQLAVHDDGIGFDPALQRACPSLGLASMRERVLLLEGELDVESTPGQGTTILVSVPLNKGKS